SASSWLVTCGIITQLRCRFAADTFRIRASGFFSIGPKRAKSTFGQGISPRPAPSVDALDGFDTTDLTKASTSSRVIRCFGPEPVTRARLTPSSRAKWRTDGEACGL